MKLYLTGAGGFIGSHVVRAALDDGWEIAVRRRPLNRLGVDRLDDRLTVLDLQELSSFTHWRPDAAILLGWIADPSTYLNSSENLTSLSHNVALVRTLIDIGCGRVVMTGSAAEYRQSTSAVTEHTPLEPQTLYAACKAAMSMIGQQLAAVSRTRFAWARLFHVYGPLEHPQRLVPSVINALLDGTTFAASTGDQRRDFIHVEDVAAALLRLASTGDSGVFNVSSGEPVTVRQVISTLADLLGCPDRVQFGAIPLRPWDPPALYGSAEKLRRLGWQPRYSLAEGLRQTVDWWIRQREQASTPEA